MNITNTKKLSIILVTHNAANYLYDCLNSVMEQTIDKNDYDLLIIDNCSNDDTIAIITEKYPHLKYIKLKKNVGFSKAYNLGISWTKGKYFLCLNQDVILANTYCEELVNFMEQNHNVAATSGRILRYDFVEHKTIPIIDSLGLKIKRHHQIIDIGQGQKEEEWPCVNTEVFGVCAAVAVYRRLAVEQVKIFTGDQKFEYFDEDFFAYKEDVDLAYRLRLNNWQAYQVSTALAYHARANRGADGLTDWQLATLASKKNSYLNYLSYRNHLAVIVKNEFWSNIIRDLPYILYYEFKKFIFMMFTNKYFWLQIFSTLSFLKNSLAKRKKVHKLITIPANNLRQWYV